jgi:RimJ/RimL family protein N-acetyltransferase
MELRTDRCILRPFVSADAPSIARHADNRKVWINLRDLIPHPYTVADAASYIVPFARNQASSVVLRRAGYQLEGTLRRSAFKDGEVLDQHMYAVTKS